MSHFSNLKVKIEGDLLTGAAATLQRQHKNHWEIPGQFFCAMLCLVQPWDGWRLMRKASHSIKRRRERMKMMKNLRSGAKWENEGFFGLFLAFRWGFHLNSVHFLYVWAALGVKNERGVDNGGSSRKKVKIVSIAILHWGMRKIIENQYLSYDPLMPLRCALPFDFFLSFISFFFLSNISLLLRCIFLKLRNSINLSYISYSILNAS